MSGKTVWLINQYASTPETGIGGRHYYLAQELARQGYNVYVIASSANHLLHKRPDLSGAYTLEPIDGFTFVWVNMPEYSEAHSKQRAINWFVFSWRLQKLAKLIKHKPDVVLCSSPSPIAFLGAQRLAKKFAAKLVFEVRDIWPLTLIELGGYSPKHPFIRFMRFVEKRAYVSSDRVISNLKNAVDHMVESGMDRSKFTWIPNGFSMTEVAQNVPLDPEVKSMLPNNKFIVGYTGTIGVANALHTLIEAADILRQYDDIAFAIVGNGREKESLQKVVADKGLSNVVFIRSIPKVQIQSMLAQFDVCFIGWIKDDLYRFGIGANKIPEYLYSGKPIAHSYSGSCDPVTEFYAGLTTEAQNPTALCNTILKLFNMTEEERNLIGKNGHRAAIDNYEYGMIATKLAKVLFNDEPK